MTTRAARVPVFLTSNGYTLIELLVVVSVIAALTGVLSPVLVGAKQSGNRSLCRSNLSNIGKAFEMYMSDYTGCYPNTGSDQYLWMGRHWRWPMKRYLGFYAKYDVSNSAKDDQITYVTNTILKCPADMDLTENYDKTSYGYSAAFYHTPEQVNSMTDKYYLIPSVSNPRSVVPCVTMNCSSVMYPTKKALVAEWKCYHSDNSATWWSWSGSRNYLFADGHVMYLKARRVRPAVDGCPNINVTVDGVAGRDVD